MYRKVGSREVDFFSKEIRKKRSEVHKFITFHHALSKPFPKNTLINRLHNLDQNRICRNHSNQESVVLRSWRGHPNCSVEFGNIRNAYDNSSDHSGQDDNGGRCSRLKERNFSRSKEMNNEDLIWSQQSEIFSFLNHRLLALQVKVLPGLKHLP